MSAVVEGKRAQRIVLLLAGGLLAVAVVLRLFIAGDDELGRLTAMLRSYGYTVRESELYIAGDYRDTTIATLLADMDLNAAVEASRQAGFPSNVHKRGDVVLILAATRAEEVITMYALNGEMELCFIQTPGSATVKPLERKDA